MEPTGCQTTPNKVKSWRRREEVRAARPETVRLGAMALSTKAEACTDVTHPDDCTRPSTPTTRRHCFAIPSTDLGGRLSSQRHGQVFSDLINGQPMPRRHPQFELLILRQKRHPFQLPGSRHKVESESEFLRQRLGPSSVMLSQMPVTVGEGKPATRKRNVVKGDAIGG